MDKSGTHHATAQLGLNGSKCSSAGPATVGTPGSYGLFLKEAPAVKTIATGRGGRWQYW